ASWAHARDIYDKTEESCVAELRRSDARPTQLLNRHEAGNAEAAGGEEEAPESSKSGLERRQSVGTALHGQVRERPGSAGCRLRRLAILNRLPLLMNPQGKAVDIDHPHPMEASRDQFVTVPRFKLKGNPRPGDMNDSRDTCHRLANRCRCQMLHVDLNS